MPGRSLSRFSFSASMPKSPVFIFVSGEASFIFSQIRRTLSSMIPILLLKSAAIDLMYSSRKGASLTHATSEQIVFRPSLMIISSLQPWGISIRLKAFGNGSVSSFNLSCVRFPFALANSSGSIPFGNRIHLTLAPAFSNNSQFFNEAFIPASSAS